VVKYGDIQVQNRDMFFVDVDLVETSFGWAGKILNEGVGSYFSITTDILAPLNKLLRQARELISVGAVSKQPHVRKLNTKVDVCD
jgi:hypothetical protein